MKTLTLPIGKLYELATVIDAVPVSELVTSKDIRLTTNLVKDLRAPCGEYGEKKTNFDVVVEEMAKPFRERYTLESDKMDTTQKKEFAKLLDTELAEQIKAQRGDELKAIEETALSEITVELGDEKFAKLKELFEKHGSKFYIIKSVYNEVADALGVE